MTYAASSFPAAFCRDPVRCTPSSPTRTSEKVAIAEWIRRTRFDGSRCLSHIMSRKPCRSNAFRTAAHVASCAEFVSCALVACSRIGSRHRNLGRRRMIKLRKAAELGNGENNYVFGIGRYRPYEIQVPRTRSRNLKFVRHDYVMQLQASYLILLSRIFGMRNFNVTVLPRSVITKLPFPNTSKLPPLNTNTD